MGKRFTDAVGPEDLRFEIHMGFFENEVDFYYPYCGSYVFTFQTDDEGQANRVFDSIDKYMNRPNRNTITGTYLHEKRVRYDGTYHPELEDDHLIEMLWYWEDYEDNSFDHFYIPIFKSPKYEE